MRNVSIGVLCALAPLVAADASTPTGYVQENGAWVGTYTDKGDADSTSSIAYNGGKTIGHVILQPVFWGSAWGNSGTSPSEAEIVAAVKQLAASTYLDEMFQYGYQDITVYPPFEDRGDPPSPFSMTDINDWIWNHLDHPFPEPLDQNGAILYMVFVPPGASYSGGSGYLGAHGPSTRTLLHLDPPSTQQTTWGAWVGGTGCGNGFGCYTSAFAHELVESISNPELDAWMMDKVYNGDGNEIGDACNHASDTLNGISVNGYYSARQHTCVLPFPPPPTLSPLGAAFGSPWGGDTLEVLGTGFDTHGATSVLFGGVASPSVSCPTSTQCYAVTPPGNGAADVQVQVNHFLTPATADDEFGYSPSISTVTPNTGTPGDIVTLTGIGLASSTVSFGPFAAGTPDCRFPPGCTIIVPPGSGDQDVRAFVNGVPSRTWSNDVFHYTAPGITSITPGNGPWSGGTRVDVIGQGFDTANDGGMQFLFDGMPATGVYCYSTIWCNMWTPLVGSAGVWPVVASVYGVSTPPAYFQFDPYPTLTGFGVQQVWEGAGAGSVSLNGNGLPAGSAVLLHSSDPTLVRVPREAVVPGGSSFATFNAHFTPSRQRTIVHLRASYQGVTLHQAITVPATPPISLSFDAFSLAVGDSSTGTVALLHPAPTGGADVRITATDATGVTYPASVKVREGHYTAQFTVTNFYNGTRKTVTFTAHHRHHTASASIYVPAPTIKPPPICPGPACV